MAYITKNTITICPNRIKIQLNLIIICILGDFNVFNLIFICENKNNENIYLGISNFYIRYFKFD